MYQTLKVKNKCSPTAITYYKTDCYKPFNIYGDPAAWLIKPPVKKPKKIVSTTPSCLKSTHYYINLWKE